MNQLIKIDIPNFCSKELEYMVHVYFGVFLGIEYTLEINDNIDHTVIEISDQKLIVENCFWKPNSEPYRIDNLPKNISNSVLSTVYGDFSMICLYGRNTMTIQNKDWILKNDIFAGGFFMLTRWEERVNLSRDNHNRFPGKASVAFNYGFLDRPIVNEYLEFLWLTLKEMGYSGKRLARKYNIVPTHDVDLPYYFKNTTHFLKKIVAKFIAFNWKALLKDISYFFSAKDPYDYFNVLMQDAEKANVKAHFFFMSGGETVYDNNYSISDKKIKDIINEIKRRNHIIGFHPSYNTYTDKSLFNSEKLLLENVLSQKVIFGRQHYLRFSIPETWNIWNKYNMKWDSSAGYADISGFRCGVCYSFPVFDFESRTVLEVYENPLIIMDVTLKNYEKLSVTDAIIKVDYFKEVIKKFNGSLVYLWHNSSFELQSWESYKNVYNRLLV